MVIYGYCRISTRKQNIERQERNIKAVYPEALIIKEIYTGSRFQGRVELDKIIKKVVPGDIIVFDSVSRMSRNADEGVQMYFELFERGIQLIFLKEHYIDTSVYRDSLRDKIELQGTDEDEIFKGLNNYFRKLAERQIRIAFEQAEKELVDLRQRTKEGIQTARLNGKEPGVQKSRVRKNPKKEAAIKIIQKHSKTFGGGLTDVEVMKLAKVTKKTYYIYKKEIIKDMLKNLEKSPSES